MLKVLDETRQERAAIALSHRREDRSTGTISDFALDQSEPYRMVDDDACLYWSNYGDAEIRRPLK